MAGCAYHADPANYRPCRCNPKWERPSRCRSPRPLVLHSLLGPEDRAGAILGARPRAPRNCVREFQVSHPQIKQRLLQKRLLGSSEITFGLFVENADGVNGL